MAIIKKLNNPISNKQRVVTSAFNDPKRSDGHYGLDIGCTYVGVVTVSSASTGIATVVTSSYNATDGYGERVVLDHGDGWFTLYAHLEKRSVNRGDTVEPYGTVGVMGSTGKSTGRHLHIEYYTNIDVPYDVKGKFKTYFVGGLFRVDPNYFFAHSYSTTEPDVEPPEDGTAVQNSKSNQTLNAEKNYMTYRWNAAPYNIANTDNDDNAGCTIIPDYYKSTLQDFFNYFNIQISQSDDTIKKKDPKTKVENNAAASQTDFTLNDFLNFCGIEADTADDTGSVISKLSNRERIIIHYTDVIKSEIGDTENLSQKQASQIYLAPGTELRVPLPQVQRTVRATALPYPVETRTTDSVAFFDERVRKLLDSSLWRSPVADSYEARKYGTLQKGIPNVTVWVQARRLGRDGELINISPYVLNLTATVGQNGGNFQMQLAPVIGECECVEYSKYKTGVWRKKGVSFGSESDNHTQNEYFAKSTINKTTTKSGNIERNNFFFNMSIGSQDVVFIRFEPLDNNDLYPFEPTKDDLHGKVWDMVGLVDTTVYSADAPNEVSVMVQGRDLTKLFIDDQHLFYYTAEFVRENTVYANQGREAVSFAVERTNQGLMSERIPYKYYNIPNTMNYYLSALQNTQIVNNDFFSSYGDERTERYIRPEKKKGSGKVVANTNDFSTVEVGLDTNGNKNNKIYTGELEKELSPGIWQIIKVVYDPKISKRILVDSSPQTDTGSIMNFLEKLCQFPFVEMLFDTWGDMFYVHVRQPPFDYNGYNALRQIATRIKNDSVYAESLGFDDREVHNAFQILPQMNVAGNDTIVFNDKIPAVIFEDSMLVYGLRSWQMRTNYVAVDTGVTVQESTRNTIENLNQDLAYVVESTMYNPFVRKGTITLTGNRRLKRGQAIFYEPTGEIFHIESVSHTYATNNGTPDRITVLQVSHGMVDAHFEKYFKIVEHITREVETGEPFEKKKIEITLNLQFEYDCHFGVNAQYDGSRVSYPRGLPHPTDDVGSYTPSAGDWYFVNQEIRNFLAVTGYDAGMLKRNRIQANNNLEINKVGETLLDNPEMKLLITGHTDSDGTETYNQQLSERRALWTAMQLTEYVNCELAKRGKAKEPVVPRSTGMNKNTGGTARFNKPLIGNTLARLTIAGAGEMKPVGKAPGGDKNPPQPYLEKQRNRRITATGTLDKKIPATNRPTETKHNWVFNKDVFDFLYRNKQFCDCE